MEDTLFKLPPTLKVGGKTYKAIDLQNEWSFKQKKIARELLTGLFDIDSAEMSGDKTVQGIQISKLAMENLSKLDLEPKLMALMYIENDEKLFTRETFETRCKELEEMNMTQEVEDALQYFFDLKGASIMKDMLTYYQSVGAGL